jgi:hypothetical protein
LPVPFTQSSLRTAATPIVCSFYAVTSSAFSFHLFLVLPRAESQSLTRATPRVHLRHQTLIPPSPIARHSLPRSPSVLVNHRRHHPSTAVAACSLLSPPVHHRCRLFPHLLPPPPPPLPPLPLPLPPPPPFTAANRCRSFSTTGSGINRYSSEVFGGHSYSFGNSLGILWIRFSC